MQVDVFAGGSRTGELMRTLDWSRTPVGPVDGWPASLRSGVRVVLSSRYPTARALTGCPRPDATLGEGELLLLYTDGLVEDRVDQLDVGPGRLLGRAGQAFDPPDGDSSGKASLAEGLLSAVFAGVDEDHADDVAVLAVLREPGRSPAGNRPADAAVATLDVHLTYPAQFDAAARMRQDLRRTLAEAAVPADVADDVLIAASEAVNNALEHAQDPRRPQVDVHLGLGADTLALQVRDHAPGWPGGRAWTGVTGRPS